jgi:hypothetical protein
MSEKGNLRASAICAIIRAIPDARTAASITTVANQSACAGGDI